MKIAIMGCGTVGAGVFDIIQHSPYVLGRGAAGKKISVKYVLDIKEFKDPEISALQIRDVDIIANDPEVELVVETMGGLHPAFDFCMKCLEKGKSVVTSNKLLVAAKGLELFAAAKAHNAAFRFGASVCGGIPVIRTLFYGMAANELEGFVGILNGTSNFVLTKMFRDHLSFEDALKQAQEKGYAEKDPTDDIEGFDAARKTAILCSVCFGRHVYPEQIHTEGISAITQADAAYAGTLNSKIKLLGFAGRLPYGQIAAGVAPAMIACDNPVAGVDGVLNAVRLFGNKVNEIMLTGPGAGREATASAVVADILDCARTPGFDPAYYWDREASDCVHYLEQDYVTFYVRGTAENKESVFGRIQRSIPGSRLLTRENAPENELAFITGYQWYGVLCEQLEHIEGFELAVKIRMA